MKPAKTQSTQISFKRPFSPYRFFRNIYNTIDLDEDMDEYKDLPEHEKMIKKLHCELSKRQTFQERLMAILQRKLETESELASKKRKLEDLKIALQSLLKVIAHMKFINFSLNLLELQTCF